MNIGIISSVCIFASHVSRQRTMSPELIGILCIGGVIIFIIIVASIIGGKGGGGSRGGGGYYHDDSLGS